MVRGKATARILIAGQAPGRRVHESGLPFDDPSGERLRDWLGVTREQFYDESLFAIVPMGFCYPGTGSGGDNPPRPECAATWHGDLVPKFKHVQLTVVIGKYALDYHLGADNRSVTDRVREWNKHWPQKLPLPHPSPRNNRWLRNNPWLESDVLPTLRRRVGTLIAD